ncbi:glycosyltransferase [Demetria terragena]|uniref:glycosyltransferase n=1 Tax=Demetria terragena TaxID=63959 RepID=UPI000377256C|nr:glycosyltransferase [Demetria terragena]
MSENSVLLVVGRVAGGAGRHVYELAAGLDDLGWRVVVACPEAVAENYRFADIGVDVVTVEIGARPDPRHDVVAVRRLRRAAGDVQVVHAHGLRAGALACLAVAATVPVAVTLHNAAPSGRSGRVVFDILQRIVARRADAILAVSEDLNAQLAQLGATSIRPAVVAAAPPRPPERERAEVREELGDPDVLALTVGRLAPQKDLDGLLDAIGQLSPDLDLLLVIAGDGPQRDALADRIATEGLHVRLLGSRDDIPDLLGAADLVVSSARWEGQPVWLQEAMHAGVPAVATNVGGTRAIVGEGSLLIPSGDSARLAQAIERLALDRELRDSLAAQALSQGQTLPTRADAVRAAEAIYTELKGRPRAGHRSR